jgi:hypothetical protein
LHDSNEQSVSFFNSDLNKTQNHLKVVSFQNQSKPISSFLPGANSTLNDKIIKADTLFSNFVAEHNLLMTENDSMYCQYCNTSALGAYS